MIEYVILAFCTVVVFTAGLAAGYWMHYSAHRDGVRLIDRIRNNQEPFEPDFNETEIQTTTGGEFEEV